MVFPLSADGGAKGFAPPPSCTAAALRRAAAVGVLPRSGFKMAHLSLRASFWGVGVWVWKPHTPGSVSGHAHREIVIDDVEMHGYYTILEYVTLAARNSGPHCSTCTCPASDADSD